MISIQDISQKIKQKTDITRIVAMVNKKPAYIKALIEALETETTSLKFGYEKILRLVSEQKPKIVYPYFDFFVKLLDTENNFLKWGAIVTISNLVRVDSRNKFEEIFKRYFRFITGSQMISANNVIGNAWKIVEAKPHLAERVVTEILKVEKAKYVHQGQLSPECRNVAIGQAIDTFAKIIDQVEFKKGIIRFVKKQLKNTRTPVQNKAKKFLFKCKMNDK